MRFRRSFVTWYCGGAAVELAANREGDALERHHHELEVAAELLVAAVAGEERFGLRREPGPLHERRERQVEARRAVLAHTRERAAAERVPPRPVPGIGLERRQ